MTAGRVLASLAAAAAVAGCIALAAGMSSAADDSDARAADRAPSSLTAGYPTYAPLLATSPAPPTATSPATSRAASPAAKTSATTRAVTTTPPPARSTARPAAEAPAKTSARASATAAKKTRAAKPSAQAATRGIALPLRYATGAATRVITVTAVSRSSTTAHLQAWQKAPGGGWLKHGRGVTAHIGAAGMTTHPSESKSATPMGSYLLTEAFGRDADPGTALPYLRTTPADWWISQPGPLYNTHQRCSSHCAFTLGSPNEHLYYETPYYDYAVVIDYNTRNTGHVVQGAGSAFFLHVTDGRPTAGCVAVPRAKLVTLMRWLHPVTHPRILIGVR